MATWDFISPLDPDQIPDEWVWERLRAERDRRLAACDWRVMPDAPDYGLVYYRDLWVQYRQALRDLPANTSDPREAVWPEEPSA